MGNQAFRWSSATGIVALGYLQGGPFANSFAEDVSADGSAVVGASSSVNSLSEAFAWRLETGMVGLGDLAGGDFHSYATAISADGEIIAGGATSALGPEAFRWTEADGMIPLGDLAGGFFSSGARDVSSDGSTIVGYGNSELSGGSIEAFRWTAGTGMQALGDLPGGEFISDPTSVSADGSVVLGYSHRAGGYRAFVWTALSGMRDLQEVLISEFGLGPQLMGWILTSASDISDDGLSIAGNGINPDGNFEAWLVRLDHPITAPEPSSLTLAFMVAALFARRSSRRRPV
jgi:probable HAF family extracellular repeat protein